MRWRMLGWICLAELGALSLWFSATAIIPALHTAWMSPTAQAWLSMAVTLGFVVGTIASAVLTLADYVGARRLFVLSAVGGAVVNAGLLIIVDSLPLVLLARFLTGVAMAGTYPPAMKLAPTMARPIGTRMSSALAHVGPNSAWRATMLSRCSPSGCCSSVMRSARRFARRTTCDRTQARPPPLPRLRYRAVVADRDVHRMARYRQRCRPRAAASAAGRIRVRL